MTVRSEDQMRRSIQDTVLLKNKFDDEQIKQLATDGDLQGVLERARQLHMFDDASQPGTDAYRSQYVIMQLEQWLGGAPTDGRAV